MPPSDFDAFQLTHVVVDIALGVAVLACAAWLALNAPRTDPDPALAEPAEPELAGPELAERPEVRAGR